MASSNGHNSLTLSTDWNIRVYRCAHKDGTASSVKPTQSIVCIDHLTKSFPQAWNKLFVWPHESRTRDEAIAKHSVGVCTKRRGPGTYCGRRSARWFPFMHLYRASLFSFPCSLVSPDYNLRVQGVSAQRVGDRQVHVWWKWRRIDWLFQIWDFWATYTDPFATYFATMRRSQDWPQMRGVPESSSAYAASTLWQRGWLQRMLTFLGCWRAKWIQQHPRRSSLVTW